MVQPRSQRRTRTVSLVTATSFGSNRSRYVFCWSDLPLQFDYVSFTFTEFSPSVFVWVDPNFHWFLYCEPRRWLLSGRIIERLGLVSFGFWSVKMVANDLNMEEGTLEIGMGKLPIMDHTISICLCSSSFVFFLVGICSLMLIHN